MVLSALPAVLSAPLVPQALLVQPGRWVPLVRLAAWATQGSLARKAQLVPIRLSQVQEVRLAPMGWLAFVGLPERIPRSLVLLVHKALRAKLALPVLLAPQELILRFLAPLALRAKPGPLVRLAPQELTRQFPAPLALRAKLALPVLLAPLVLILRFLAPLALRAKPALLVLLALQVLTLLFLARKAPRVRREKLA